MAGLVYRFGFVVWLGLFGAVPAGAAPQVLFTPAQPSPGEVFRLTVEGVEGAEGLVARFGERDFPLWQVDATTWEGLAAVDRDASPGATPLHLLAQGGRERQSFAVASVEVLPRQYPEQHLRVRDGLVHLSPEDEERAARENRLMRQVLNRKSGERLWRETFALPVNGPVTGAFGVRRVYNGTPKSYHSGLDLAAPRGTPVGASAAGTVALVGDFFYTGHTIFVDHGLGLYTAYFHLDAVSVQEGQELAALTELGRVGSTGRSTGPHLHWGVYLAGQKADPLSLLQAFGAAAGGDSP